MLNVNDLIVNDLQLEFDNILIIGDNASGKTYVLEKMLRNENGLPYYISVHNRGINLSFMHLNSPIHLNKSDVKKLNLKRVENINGEDTWIDNSLGNNIFATGFFKFKNVIEMFFNSEISIVRKEEMFRSEISIIINGTSHPTLSNGLSSIFRILLELEVASNLGCDTVFIDEIEKYLDSTNSFNLIKFIQNKYSHIRLVITTHSDDVIIGSSDFCIIKINNDSNDVNEKSIDVYNSNDFDSIISTKRTFFPVSDNLKYEYEFERVNSIYMNLLVNDSISIIDQEYLNNLTLNRMPSKILNIMNEIEILRY